MNKKLILAAVLMVLAAVGEICFLFAIGATDTRDFIDFACHVAGYILMLCFAWQFQKLQRTYQDILRDAFQNDKRSRKKLRVAYRLYSMGQYTRVMKQADKLESVCAEGADYAAIYMLRALCYGGLGKTDEAVRCCETVEQYGFTVPEAAKDAIFHSKTIKCKSKTGR